MAALLAGGDLVGVALATALVAGGTGPDRLAVLLAYPPVVVALRYRHRVRLCLRLADELGRMILAAGLPALGLTALVPAASATRLAAVAAGSLLLARALAYGALRRARRRGWATDTAVVVGAGEMGVLVAEALAAHPELGAVPAGFVDSLPPPEALPFPVLGATGELADVVAAAGATRVLVCFPVERDRDLVPVLRDCRSARVDVCLVPRLAALGVAVRRSDLDEVWGIPLVPLRLGAAAPGAAAVKRALDVLVAALALLAAAPLVALLGGVLRLRHGSPVLFRQLRVTGRGRTAQVLKLRTLPPQAAPDTTWSGAAPPDGLRGFLRARHLDELPQLWNVLRGDLSLVGPRPERPFFAERFAEEIEGYAGRDRMPAGLTGWAQVHGLHGDTSLAERARFDNAAIEWWSPLLDLVVLARTLLVVAHGACARTVARRRRRGCER